MRKRVGAGEGLREVLRLGGGGCWQRDVRILHYHSGFWRTGLLPLCSCHFQGELGGWYVRITDAQFAAAISGGVEGYAMSE